MKKIIFLLLICFNLVGYSQTKYNLDEIVKAHQDQWLVELNNSNLPAIIVEKNYAKELRKKLSDKTAREFVQTKFGEAKWLEKAIEKRKSTTSWWVSFALYC